MTWVRQCEMSTCIWMHLGKFDNLARYHHTMIESLVYGMTWICAMCNVQCAVCTIDVFHFWCVCLSCSFFFAAGSWHCCCWMKMNSMEIGRSNRIMYNYIVLSFGIFYTWRKLISSLFECTCFQYYHIVFAIRQNISITMIFSFPVTQPNTHSSFLILTWEQTFRFATNFTIDLYLSSQRTRPAIHHLFITTYPKYDFQLASTSLYTYMYISIGYSIH